MECRKTKAEVHDITEANQEKRIILYSYEMESPRVQNRNRQIASKARKHNSFEPPLILVLYLIDWGVILEQSQSRVK